MVSLLVQDGGEEMSDLPSPTAGMVVPLLSVKEDGIDMVVIRVCVCRRVVVVVAEAERERVNRC
jgi:hypothetical protein